jgi:hypothetical protein
MEGIEPFRSAETLKSVDCCSTQRSKAILDAKSTREGLCDYPRADRCRPARLGKTSCDMAFRRQDRAIARGSVAVPSATRPGETWVAASCFSRAKVQVPVKSSRATPGSATAETGSAVQV